MIYYDSLAIFINSASELKDRIKNIKLVMSALRAQRLAVALNPNQANVSEYILDDGQTRISTTYRGLDQIDKSMRALERELQDCYNQLNGRITRNVDSKNLTNWRNGI